MDSGNKKHAIEKEKEDRAKRARYYDMATKKPRDKAVEAFRRPAYGLEQQILH